MLYPKQNNSSFVFYQLKQKKNKKTKPTFFKLYLWFAGYK